MVLIDDAEGRLPQENLQIKCSEIASEATMYILVKMVESPVVALQPVKPLETIKQNCQKWSSHITNFQRGKVMRVA